MLPGDVVGKARVARLPAVPEGVGEFEVGPLGPELGEGDEDGDQVGGADFEQVWQHATAVVRVGEVEAALTEFVGQGVIDIEGGPVSGFASELVGDGVAARSELLACVADAVDRRVVGSQGATE